MKLAIASDHAGVALKAALIQHLTPLHALDDLGPHDTTSVDYPDFALALALKVQSGEVERGILICGTGIGMSIAANKVAGVRAAVVHDTFSAKACVEHNNLNVLCLGARVVGEGLALELCHVWLNAHFAGGRHQRRLDKIAALESHTPVESPR